MQKSDRATYVKNMNLNPAELNPYDRLSNSFWRWRQLVTTQGSKLSEEQKQKAASNYYDHMLAPTYKELGAEAMPKDLWMKEAFGAALKYDPEGGQYSGALWKGFKLGALRGFADLERLGGTAVDLLGGVVKYNASGSSWDQWMKQHTRPSEGLMDKMHEAALSVPALGYVSRSIHNVANEDQFFADAVPAQGFMENASSMVTEQALLLPLYEGIGSAMKLFGAAAKTVPAVENLTETLNSTAAGRRALPLLFAGVEGAATGAVLTAPGQGWKREAWQSAIGFMAAHTVFGLAGAGLGAIGKGVSRVAGRRTAALGEVLEGAEKEAFDNHIEELKTELQGKHVATPDEQVEAYKKAYASYASASGVPGLKALGEQAIQFAKEHKSKSTLELLKFKQDMLEHDRAKWNPVFNALRVMQKLSGGKDIASMSEEDLGKLRAAHDNFISDSLTDLPHTEGVKGATVAEASQVAKTPVAQKQIQRKVAALKAQDAASGMNKGKPDSFYQQRAEQWYLEQNAKGTAKMAERASELPVKEVKKIASKRVDVENPTIPTKYRSQYEYDKHGRVTGYSLSAAKDYKVYATRAAKESGFGNLKDWFQDLSDEDFVKDLEDWFYPKDLKDGGFFFEHESSDPGKNPNFLAFMYNYVDHMPPELGAELKQRLTDQAKVAMKLGSNVDEDRLTRYYALQMWNHVDDFLGALKHHKGEFNLFRSTQSDLLNPTKYQKQLIEEKMAEERKNFEYMYRKHPDALGSVLAVYDKLAAERYKLMMKKTSKVTDEDVARALKRQDINLELGEMQSKTGDFEHWRF